MSKTFEYETYLLKRKNCLNDNAVLELQKEYLLPVIEEEKAQFIRAEYSRLQSAIGNEYHIGSERHIFHPLPENASGDTPPQGNPYELTLNELVMLPNLEKCIPRMGTLSYMPLFRMHPSDSLRLNLLANMYEKMLIGKCCSEEDIEKLLCGHKAYMQFKLPEDNDVVIIKY